MLHSLKKPVLSIVGADGHLIVFRKVSDEWILSYPKDPSNQDTLLGPDGGESTLQ